jgi:hypothetical protein
MSFVTKESLKRAGLYIFLQFVIKITNLNLKKGTRRENALLSREGIP